MYRGNDRTIDRLELGEGVADVSGPPGRPRNRIPSLHQRGRVISDKVKILCTHCGITKIVDAERMEKATRGRQRCDDCGGIVVPVNQCGMS